MWQESTEPGSKSPVTSPSSSAAAWPDTLSRWRVESDQMHPLVSLQLALSHVREIARGHGLWSGFREAAGLGIRTEGRNETARLILSGELDYASASLIEDSLAVAQAEHDSIVVDLDDLTFMDSSGIEVFLHAEQRADASGGRIRIVNAHKHHRVFMLCGAQSLLGE